MKDIDEIERELATAYTHFRWWFLRLWNLDALIAHREELQYQMGRLREQWGERANNAIGTLLNEYYDVDEEIEVREYEPDPELLASMADWTGPHYTKHTNLSNGL